jgi:hypothetical protein
MAVSNATLFSRKTGPQLVGQVCAVAITRATSPYEPDPTFDDPVIRKRVGEVIAKAMERK